jgi:ubiquinone/menaquinone biosynthesis C-methylase UbiE
MKNWIKIERIPGLLASSYEKATRLVIKSYYPQVAEEIVANLQKGLILDLGTGPGYLPIEIVKRAPDIHIVGIDLSRKLIQMAQVNASKAGLSEQLSFEVGNAGRLRFENDAFDMVISTGMLHSLKDPIDVLQEIYRVLKKGGQAWIYDPAKVASQIDKKQWRASLSARERFFLWFFSVIRLFNPITTYSREQVSGMIAATAFKKYWIEDKKDEIKIKLEK